MTDAVLWIVLAGALVVGEVLTLTTVAGLLAGGAVAAFAVALLTDSVPVQLGVFAAVSSLLLVLVRPLAVRQRAGRELPGGVVGAVAVVVQAVEAGGGQVRLNGELWRARPEVDSDVLAVGSRVLVHAVDGATVLVYPVDPVPPAPDVPLS